MIFPKKTNINSRITIMVLIIWIMYRKISKITPKMSASSNEIDEMLKILKSKAVLVKLLVHFQNVKKTDNYED